MRWKRVDAEDGAEYYDAFGVLKMMVWQKDTYKLGGTTAKCEVCGEMRVCGWVFFYLYE